MCFMWMKHKLFSFFSIKQLKQIKKCEKLYVIYSGLLTALTSIFKYSNKTNHFTTHV